MPDILPRMMTAECVVNPNCNCPKCGSNFIDQVDSDTGDYTNWYHCLCGVWYNEEGEIDSDDND